MHTVNDGAHPDPPFHWPGRPTASSTGRGDRLPLPLAGVRILALEQMQALPFATQLMSRLGADVVKVEPLSGELGR